MSLFVDSQFFPTDIFIYACVYAHECENSKKVNRNAVKLFFFILSDTHSHATTFHQLNTKHILQRIVLNTRTHSENIG